MGGPKAIMQVAGRPWWHWQRERMGLTGLSQHWVMSRSVRHAIPTAEIAEATESASDAPMFDSVVLGLNGILASGKALGFGVFVLPVDVPSPGAAVYEALIGAGEAAAPMHGDRKGHPLLMPWSFIRSHVLAASRSADEASRRLDRLVRPRLVPVDDRSVITNLNTPEDVQAWVAGDGSDQARSAATPQG